MLALVNLPIIISDDIIWNESTDKDATVTVTDVYSKYVYGWET